MKVELTDVNEIERRMMVAVPQDTVATEIDKAYQKLKKTVKLRGFRPGKAPLPGPPTPGWRWVRAADP